jgi:hypothetical protein
MTTQGVVPEGLSLEADVREQLRDLLVRHQKALEACEALAMAVLESVQPDPPALTGDQAHERRQTAAQAVALAQSGQTYLDELWRVSGVDRRMAAPDAALPAAIRQDRRRKSRKRRR